MRHGKRRRWWGLYLLAPLDGGLLFAEARLHGAATWHTIILLAIVGVTCALAFAWSESHADLLGSEGADAWAEQQSLAELGHAPGTFAASTTTRQALYRQVMLARRHPRDTAVR